MTAPIPHLLVAISSHGYGHLAQVAPAINALETLSQNRQAPAFELTIRSNLAPRQLANRVQRAFKVDFGSDDFGMVMHDALRVDLVSSLQRYAQLHERWDREVDQLAAHLLDLNVSALVANAPYLTLAAARLAQIPSMGICSLNWADILEQCVQQRPDALKASGLSKNTLDRILEQMRQAYASAALVLRPEPAMPMTHSNTLSIEPLVHQPPEPNRHQLLTVIDSHLRSQAGHTLAADEPCWLVLTSMGGIRFTVDPDQWPTQCLGRRVIYLMSGDTVSRHGHVVSLNFEHFGFSELMASCDVLLTKPGYGMFVEGRACGKPLLYVEREHWPESSCLEQWAESNTHAIKLTVEQINSGHFASQLEQILSRSALGRRGFAGADQAALAINRHLLTAAHGH